VLINTRTTSSDAPLDQLILTIAKPKWQKVARVIIKARKIEERRTSRQAMVYSQPGYAHCARTGVLNFKEIYPGGGTVKCGFL